MFLSIINCLTLDTVVTLFQFIQRSVPISYLFIYLRVKYFYLFIYRRAPIFIHLSQIAWNSISESLDYVLGTEQLSALNRKIGRQKDRTER